MAVLNDTTVNGNLNVTGRVDAQQFNATCDARLKTNIKLLEYRPGILDLPIYEFDYVDSGIHSIGFLAQDVRKIYPELVNENDEGFLSISETKIAYLILQEMKHARKL